MSTSVALSKAPHPEPDQGNCESLTCSCHVSDVVMSFRRVSPTKKTARVSEIVGEASPIDASLFVKNAHAE